MSVESLELTEENTGTVRDRILAAVLRLLAEGGASAVSTRAVCAAAETNAPTIYRLFGDKRGLLDAASTVGCAEYLRNELPGDGSGDPVEDLRANWHAHVRFGIDHPGLYAAMQADPRPDKAPATDAVAKQIRPVAEAGRLRVSEQHAAQLVYATVFGLVNAQLQLPPERRDPAVADLAWNAVAAAILLDEPAAPDPGPAAAAIALRARLPQTAAVLTDRERGLLEEWLDRIAAHDNT